MWTIFIVNKPHVMVSTNATATINEPLILQCDATTMIGVNTGVDIVWDKTDTVSGKKVFRRVVGANSSLNGNNLEYKDSFTIPMLKESHNGVVYQCTVTINFGGRQVFHSAKLSLKIFSKYNGHINCIMNIGTFIN